MVDGVELAPVAPNDLALGLALAVERCTDDVADWAPGPYNSWLDGDPICGPVADAILQRHRDALVAALEGARASCTLAGYRIVMLGFADYLLNRLRDDTPRIEPGADPTPQVAVDVAGDLRMTIGPDAARRPGWLDVRLAGQGTDGWHAPVHRSRLVGFVAALQEVATGRAETAALVSLGRAWELVVGHQTVSGRLAPTGADPETTFSLPVPRTTPGRLYAALRPHRSSW